MNLLHVFLILLLYCYLQNRSFLDIVDSASPGCGHLLCAVSLTENMVPAGNKVLSELLTLFGVDYCLLLDLLFVVGSPYLWSVLAPLFFPKKKGQGIMTTMASASLM